MSTAQLWFGGLGSVRSNLKLLVMKLLNYIIPRFEELLNKILSFEWRLRCEFLHGFVSVMAVCIDLSEELYGTTMGLPANLTNFSATRIMGEYSFNESINSAIPVNPLSNDGFSMDSLRHTFQIVLE